MRTCVRVSIKGSSYGNFRRALRTGNLTVIRAAAAELPAINLEEALSICLLLAQQEPRNFERAALRWARRTARRDRSDLTCVLRRLWPNRPLLPRAPQPDDRGRVRGRRRLRPVARGRRGRGGNAAAPLLSRGVRRLTGVVVEPHPTWPRLTVPKGRGSPVAAWVERPSSPSDHTRWNDAGTGSSAASRSACGRACRVRARRPVTAIPSWRSRRAQTKRTAMLG